MSENNSLIELKSRRKGIKALINNVIETLKSKVNKNYILSENSPEHLRRNKELILQTIKKNSEYLDQVPEDIILEELTQPSIPVDGIINTAFKNGYVLNRIN